MGDERESNAERAVAVRAAAVAIDIKEASVRTTVIAAAPVEPRAECKPKVHVLAIPHMIASVSIYAIVCFI